MEWTKKVSIPFQFQKLHYGLFRNLVLTVETRAEYKPIKISVAMSDIGIGACKKAEHLDVSYILILN